MKNQECPSVTRPHDGEKHEPGDHHSCEHRGAPLSRHESVDHAPGHEGHEERSAGNGAPGWPEPACERASTPARTAPHEHVTAGSDQSGERRRSDRQATRQKAGRELSDAEEERRTTRHVADPSHSPVIVRASPRHHGRRPEDERDTGADECTKGKSLRTEHPRRADQQGRHQHAGPTDENNREGSRSPVGTGREQPQFATNDPQDARHRTRPYGDPGRTTDSHPPHRARRRAEGTRTSDRPDPVHRHESGRSTRRE